MLAVMSVSERERKKQSGLRSRMMFKKCLGPDGSAARVYSGTPRGGLKAEHRATRGTRWTRVGGCHRALLQASVANRNPSVSNGFNALQPSSSKLKSRGSLAKRLNTGVSSKQFSKSENLQALHCSSDHFLEQFTGTASQTRRARSELYSS